MINVLKGDLYEYKTNIVSYYHSNSYNNYHLCNSVLTMFNTSTESNVGNT
ncbi:MAG: hypothetical protein LBU74_02220 [Methanobacteriaceae archaeon]|nr:hypothetical protein [Candidatus Methanorudis spinitermitis]